MTPYHGCGEAWDRFYWSLCFKSGFLASILIDVFMTRAEGQENGAGLN